MLVYIRAKYNSLYLLRYFIFDIIPSAILLAIYHVLSIQMPSSSAPSAGRSRRRRRNAGPVASSGTGATSSRNRRRRRRNGGSIDDSIGGISGFGIGAVDDSGMDGGQTWWLDGANESSALLPPAAYEEGRTASTDTSDLLALSQGGIYSTSASIRSDDVDGAGDAMYQRTTSQNGAEGFAQDFINQDDQS